MRVSKKIDSINTRTQSIKFLTGAKEDTELKGVKNYICGTTAY
jgi:hypothetical protein